MALVRVELVGSNCVLRPWRHGDEASLVKHANNRNVWRNLRDIFPHPYTRRDAASWINYCEASEPPPLNLAITYDGEAIGGIGISPGIDVFRKTAEIGYWLSENFWGRGIATEALKLMTRYAFAEFDLVRLEAWVFAWNPASARVLEKSGYKFEGRLERSVFKDGELTDRLVYSKIRDEMEGQ
jgi:ribosomal-protein-alanine N-acetyltransferase